MPLYEMDLHSIAVEIYFPKDVIETMSNRQCKFLMKTRGQLLERISFHTKHHGEDKQLYLKWMEESIKNTLTKYPEWDKVRRTSQYIAGVYDTMYLVKLANLALQGRTVSFPCLHHV